MNYRIVRVFPLLLFIWISLVPLDCVRAEQTIERFVVSVPNFTIKKDERIVGIRTTITHGFLVSVPRIPHGWYLNVDITTQSTTIVTAGSTIGVADLTNEETNFFDNFLIIETPHSEMSLLNIEVVIMTTIDSINKQSTVIKMKDLELNKE